MWLTGLSGAGKTTISLLLEEELGRRGLPVERLDGDAVRLSLCRDLGFSREDRMRNLERVTLIAKLLTRQAVVVITALISPYREARERARWDFEAEGGFVEVYVRCPLEECIRRDVKGLYARALRGEIPAFTGISDPYEGPEKPDILLETDKLSPQACCDIIMAWLEEKGYVPSCGEQEFSIPGLRQGSGSIGLCSSHGSIES